MQHRTVLRCPFQVSEPHTPAGDNSPIAAGVRSVPLSPRGFTEQSGNLWEEWDLGSERQGKRGDYLRKLYKGVLPQPRKYLPAAQRLEGKRGSSTGKRLICARVRKVLFPMTSRRLPKVYETALTDTYTRRSVVHKLTAYCCIPNP